jgi:hypothetical protein
VSDAALYFLFYHKPRKASNDCFGGKTPVHPAIKGAEGTAILPDSGGAGTKYDRIPPADIGPREDCIVFLGFALYVLHLIC